jgi:hypothetical protein
LIRLAWSGKKEIHYIVPILSGALFGFSYVLNMVCRPSFILTHLHPTPSFYNSCLLSLTTPQLCLPIYNNDVYTIHYGASVLAASTFMRFTFSANFPLFTAQMIDRLGFAWATSLLGFITVGMIPIPWVFWKWGPVLRRGTRYLKHLEVIES